MAEENTITTMPALALRGLTVFPNMLLHFDVSRESSVHALDKAMSENSSVFLVSQRNLSVEEPGEKDLFSIGTICTIRQLLRMPGDNVRVMVEGVSRGRLLELSAADACLTAQVETLPASQPVRQTARTEALVRTAYGLFEHYVELSPRLNSDLLLSILSSDDPGYIADYIAQNIPMRTEDKQAIL